jgi:hypothetical protein
MQVDAIDTSSYQLIGSIQRMAVELRDVHGTQAGKFDLPLLQDTSPQTTIKGSQYRVRQT